MKRKLCQIFELPVLGDDRGKLIVIEGNKNVPFEIKRIFYIFGSDADVIRGKHANIDSEFVLINVAGSSKVMVTDGVNQEVIELNKPMKGIYIPQMIWKEMYDFSSDSVLLVMASTHYNGSEYLRDFNDYLKIMKNRDLSDVEEI